MTEASVHDSQVLGELLDIDNPDERIWADSAYRSEARLEVLGWMGFDPLFNERAYRNSPLSDEQKAANRERSKTRACLRQLGERQREQAIAHDWHR